MLHSTKLIWTFFIYQDGGVCAMLQEGGGRVGWRRVRRRHDQWIYNWSTAIVVRFEGDPVAKPAPPRSRICMPTGWLGDTFFCNIFAYMHLISSGQCCGSAAKKWVMVIGFEPRFFLEQKKKNLSFCFAWVITAPIIQFDWGDTRESWSGRGAPVITRWRREVHPLQARWISWSSDAGIMCELKELKEGGLDIFCSATSGRNYGLWIRLNVKTISGVFVSLVCLHFLFIQIFS